MPIYAVNYEYADDEVRLDAVRPDHRAFLRSLAETGRLLASGPLLGAGRNCALIVVQADDAEGAAALLDPDPFRAQGLLAHRTVTEWKPVIGVFAHLLG